MRRTSWIPGNRVFQLFAVILATVGATLGCAAHAAAKTGLLTAAVAEDTLASAADSARADTARVDSTALQRVSESLAAKGASAAPETLTTPRQIAAPVFLGGKMVFRVRSSRDGLTPAQRAAAIRARLTGAVADPQVAADSVRLLTTPQGVEVRLSRHFLWVITPADVEGVGHSDLSARLAELPALIRDGVEKERVSRRPIGILISALIALAVTAVALLVGRVLRYGARRWNAWLRVVLPKHLGGVRIRSYEVLSKTKVTDAVCLILSRLDLLVGAALLFVYMTFLFSLFPWTQGWSWQLLHLAGVKLTEVARSTFSALPGLAAIAVIVTLCRWTVRLFDRFFDSIAAGTHRIASFHPELARPSKRLVKILLWLAAAIIAVPYVPGAQSKAFQGVSIFLGILLSLGSTGVVGNIIAGLVLTYSQSFRVGDRVKIGDQVGDVVNLGFFATKLHTIRNEEVTLPNGQVTSSAVVNYTRLAQDPGLILHTQVTIGYDAEWRKVHELLISAALRVDGIEKNPTPWVFQRSLDDSYVVYELNCVTHRSHPQLELYSELHAEIQDAFNRAGVEILSPAYHAIRDASAAVLPSEPKGPRPEPGAFRVRES